MKTVKAQTQSSIHWTADAGTSASAARRMQHVTLSLCPAAPDLPPSSSGNPYARFGTVMLATKCSWSIVGSDAKPARSCNHCSAGGLCRHQRTKWPKIAQGIPGHIQGPWKPGVRSPRASNKDHPIKTNQGTITTQLQSAGACQARW
jgi:hypothetical protein